MHVPQPQLGVCCGTLWQCHKADWPGFITAAMVVCESRKLATRAVRLWWESGADAAWVLLRICLLAGSGACLSTARRVDAGAFEFLRECFEECHMGCKPEHRLEGFATAESLVIATCVLPFAYTREQGRRVLQQPPHHALHSASSLLKKTIETAMWRQFSPQTHLHYGVYT